MKLLNETLHLSASDLVAHLNCQHLTALDIRVATGNLAKPSSYDPLLEILRERGHRHEQAFIDHLEESGLKVTLIAGVDITDNSIGETLAAMRRGDPIIAQAALLEGRWSGRADILRRVDTPSSLGPYSYEIIDTKLARETKGGTILQLCLYADLLSAIQSVAPEYIYVVAPWSDFEPQRFRFADYAAYYRRVKAAAEEAAATTQKIQSYPDPKPHCDICRWEKSCDRRRREDDHLSLVAGISKNQISELTANGFGTVEALADMSLPLPFKPQRGSPQSFEKAQQQAAVQVEGRNTDGKKHVLLEVVPEFGLAALPAPSPGDVFFDIESDAFVGEHGLEYLFGYAFFDDGRELKYIADWAFDRADEKAIFERFVDLVTARRAEFPDMHVYHFGGYEAGALKRLMGRYASREDDVDNFLRGHVLVDLLSITRNAMRASVESYSLKKLEPFFGFERQVPLHDANVALTKLSAGLELDDIPSIDSATKETVAAYNRDDCVSTARLRDWLEGLRSTLVESGTDVPRPAPSQDGPSEELDERQKYIQALIEKLTSDVPVDPEERTNEQQARWLLAHILDWHRRENKAVWWEFFRLHDLSADELLEEKGALSRLTLIDTVDHSPTGIPTHRYRFDPQDTDLRGGDDVYGVGGGKIGSAIEISQEDRTIDIKKSRATAEEHPEAVFAHKFIDPKEQAASLLRLGEYVAEHGIEGPGEYLAARELLLRKPMSANGEPFRYEGEDSLKAALRLAGLMEGGVLPIQGPPGTGKSFTGARMICELARQGKRVGITASNHKVIRNLLDEVIAAAPELGVDMTCLQKPETGNQEGSTDTLIFVRNNADVISALETGQAQVAGATSFFWAREDARDLVDVLVIDEAGQMSLANVLSVAQSAKTLLLLGDPQQLDQPTQGTHPEGTGVSALDHLLNGSQTISEDQGLFLETTYRMHPDVCSFNSELFYEGKLHPVKGCELQGVHSRGPVSGCGLRFLPVQHDGNTSSSIEEADAVARLVTQILSGDTTWTDRMGKTQELTLDDILIIAPYNAQVIEIQQRLPDARVGTVDKFQGQQAPITIYSMATSSHADAPRGMEFLYSANRFNVAISRAKCLAILVASPRVFEAECRTPRQMQLANAFCRYLELSVEIQLPGVLNSVVD